MIDLLLSVLILVSLARIGACVIDRTIGQPFTCRLERFLFGCATGVGLAAYFFLLLGVVRLYYPLAAWLFFLGACVVALFLRGNKAQPLGGGEGMGERSRTAVEVLLVAVIGSLTVINFIDSAVPTVNADTLSQYFVFPRTWVRDHRQTGDFAHFYSDNIALTTSLLHVFAMLLRGDVLAQMLTGFSMGILCLMVVYRLARNYFHRELALLAAAIFYANFEIAWISSSGKVNLLLCSYELLALYALFRWIDSSGRDGRERWFLLSALMCGFALSVIAGSILTVSVIALFFAVGMIATERRGLAYILKRCLVFACVVAAVGCPLYLRNLATTGNPVFPRLMSLFGGHYSGIQFKDYYKAFSGLRGYFLMLWFNTMDPLRNISYSPSPLLLALVPGVLIMKRLPRAILLMMLYCFCFSIPWYVLAQRNRYTLSAQGLLVIVVGFVCYSCVGRRRAILSAVIPLAVIFSSREDIKRYADHSLRDTEKVLCALGLVSPEGYLERFTRTIPLIPNYGMCLFINKTLPDSAKVFIIQDEPLLWIEKPYLSVRVRTGEEIMWTRDERQVIERLATEGITHVIYSESFVPSINAWFRKLKMFDPYLPEDNVFASNVFRKKYLRLLHRDEDEYLYEVRYPHHENL